MDGCSLDGLASIVLCVVITNIRACSSSPAEALAAIARATRRLVCAKRFFFQEYNGGEFRDEKGMKPHPVLALHLFHEGPHLLVFIVGAFTSS